MRRLQQASDSDVVACMTVNMEQNAAIPQMHDDSSFRFLFPRGKGGVNGMRLRPHPPIERCINIDTVMMSPVYGCGKHTVTPAEREQAQRDIQQVVKVLGNTDGSNISLMAETQRGLAKKSGSAIPLRMCGVTYWRCRRDKAAGIIRMAIQDEAP